ncbi:c-type cytochrome biogenesis protein CcmI [Ruegeria sp. HKCCD7255]|uniref:c-type cytochrome biogenesis protein CcmI n=1 Tax=Ruegeria sp. HKCCD7255 TaxID=2683004 RepID=UPI001489A21F|nr:c-type cytochrome biogenesis protein CcmI [Ruegeria sp. HKCCD7255]
MTFWILIFFIAAVVSGFLGFVLLRGRSQGEPAAAYDLRVYREQLACVDRDLARGVIGDEDAERVRTEISRRILAADAQMQGEHSGTGPSRAVTVITLVSVGAFLIAGAMLMYRQMGAVGFPDMPLAERIALATEFHANRPSQTAAEAAAPPAQPSALTEEYQTLLTQLRDAVGQRRDDLQGHILLAQHETNVGNFKAGYEAQTRVIELSGDAASAQNYADLAEMMILAAGGYVSPEAEQALAQALERNPDLGPARYYMGQMLAQTGRPDLAYRLWVDIVRTSPADAPWVQAIRAQLDELAFRAGVFNAPNLSPSAPGPTQADVEAAAEMTPEERQEMIRGMVNNLSDRLATEGGSPQDWARLIAALGVLGEAGRAIAIRDEAETVFADDPEALRLIEEAALRAGIAK